MIEVCQSAQAGQCLSWRIWRRLFPLAYRSPRTVTTLGEPRAHAGGLLHVLQLLPRASDVARDSYDGSWFCWAHLDN